MRMYACLFCLELRLLALALLNLAGACAILVYKVIVFSGVVSCLGIGVWFC